MVKFGVLGEPFQFRLEKQSIQKTVDFFCSNTVVATSNLLQRNCYKIRASKTSEEKDGRFGLMQPELADCGGLSYPLLWWLRENGQIDELVDNSPS